MPTPHDSTYRLFSIWLVRAFRNVPLNDTATSYAWATAWIPLLSRSSDNLHRTDVLSTAIEPMNVPKNHLLTSQGIPRCTVLLARSLWLLAECFYRQAELRLWVCKPLLLEIFQSHPGDLYGINFLLPMKHW